MGSGIAQLRSKGVVERLAGHFLVDIEERRKAPQHRVPVPVGGRHVVARASRGHTNQLLGIDRLPPCIEFGEQVIAVHQQVKIRLPGGPGPCFAPRRRLLHHAIGPVALQHFLQRPG